MEKREVVSAIQNMAKDLHAITATDKNVISLFSAAAHQYNEALAADQSSGKRTNERFSAPLLTCTVEDSIWNSKEIKTTVQEMGRAFHTNAIAEGQAYSVYSNMALQHNMQLAADQAEGKRMDSELAPPFMTCSIHSKTIMTTINPNGVEGTVDELHGLMTLALANHNQNAHIFACGGVLGLHEADDDYNDLNRTITHGMQLLYKHPLIGAFNLTGDVRKAVACGISGPLQELPETVKASELRNFFADFILPAATPESQQLHDELIWLLRYWNSSKEQKQELLQGQFAWLGKGNEVESMMHRIQSAGGFLLHWT